MLARRVSVGAGSANRNQSSRLTAVEQRSLGRGGPRVSALGFGCGAVGGLMVRGEPGEQVRAVGRALEAGITYFDTAPSYGDGRSEENLGRALASLSDGGRALVGTKVRLSASPGTEPAVAIRRSLEESLRRLRRDRVDLFQLHDPVQETPAEGSGDTSISLVLGEIAAAMDRVVEDGLAGLAGLTGLGDTGSLLRVVDEERFRTVQTYFNAINPSGVWPGATGGEQDFRGLVARAADRGLGVLAIRVYAAGALAGAVARHPVAGQVGGRPLAHGAGYADDVERSDHLARLAAAVGLESGLELGLRFAMSAPGISTVLFGLSSIDHLEAAIRWAERGALDPPAVDLVVEAARGAGPA